VISPPSPRVARPAIVLNLTNAEVRGRGKCLDLTDDALLGDEPAPSASTGFGGPHVGGHAFVDERGHQFSHDADDGVTTRLCQVGFRSKLAPCLCQISTWAWSDYEGNQRTLITIDV
jgi:hypothetical protein